MELLFEDHLLHKLPSASAGGVPCSGIFCFHPGGTVP